MICYSYPITEGIKKGETFASLLNIHGGDILVFALLLLFLGFESFSWSNIVATENNLKT
jgi:hypothetical protein